MDVRQEAERTLSAELDPVLILSDPNECNENFLIVIKAILDNVYLTDIQVDDSRTYETILKYALKVLCSNLFIKNHHFCLGKIVSLLLALNDHDPGETPPDVYYQGQCLKEFLCVCLLLLLKSKNLGEKDLIQIDVDPVYQSLRQANFVLVLTQFIGRTMELVVEGCLSYVLLKFLCDIWFEYLYHVVVLDKDEYQQMVDLNLVKIAISQLVDNDQFDNYDIDDGYDLEDQLIAYEQFKLMLLINEQCLMTKYGNVVYDTLRQTLLAAFTNLAIYHLNREESQIVCILILKFLYMIFVSGDAVTAAYTNDLKILIDICIRELNNLHWEEGDLRVLVVDYLRVLLPLVENSQMGAYKVNELSEVMNQFVSLSDESDVIYIVAKKILLVEWFADANQRQRSPLDLDDSLPMVDISKAFTRLASVRTSTRADYHKHTLTHNHDLSRKALVKSNYLDHESPMGENNPDNILDLPQEYLLAKPLPKLPVPARRRQMYTLENLLALLIGLVSLLVRKALTKRAPPPPPLSQDSVSPLPIPRSSVPPLPVPRASVPPLPVSRASVPPLPVPRLAIPPQPVPRLPLTVPMPLPTAPPPPPPRRRRT